MKRKIRSFVALLLSFSILASMMTTVAYAQDDAVWLEITEEQKDNVTYVYDENGNLIKTIVDNKDLLVDEVPNNSADDAKNTGLTSTEFDDGVLYESITQSEEGVLGEDPKANNEDESASDLEEMTDEYDDKRESTFYESLLSTNALNEFIAVLTDAENSEKRDVLTTAEIEELFYHASSIAENEDLEIEALTLLYSLPNAPESPFATLEEFDGVVNFDISFGSIQLTDTSYEGYDLNGQYITGEHLVDNQYYIYQSTDVTVNTISVGTKDTPTNVAFEIHLHGINVDAPGEVGNHAAAIYVNANDGRVYLVLDDNTTNTVKAYGKIFTNGSKSALLAEEDRFGHAAIEKEVDTKGTLVISCEIGYRAYKADITKGHDCSHDGNCGKLNAYSYGEAAFNTSGNTRTSAAAAIGSAAEISETSNKRTSLTNAPTMGTLYYLIFAGGVIYAQGTFGNSNASAYLGGSPGIGVGAGFQQYSIGYALNYLKITGGHLTSVAGDGSAANFGGGYHAGYVTVNIYGGTIIAQNQLTNNKDPRRAAALGGGGGGSTSNATAGATVNIYGGSIAAYGEYGAAIGSGAGGSKGKAQKATVNIYGGCINATTKKGNAGNGAGAAIGAGGSLGTGYGGQATVNISGGTIIASSELGADIGGGGTNSTSTSGVGGKGIITISGGNITAMNGGVGGGNANAGKGGDANLTVNGGVINASKISGGNSKKNNGGRAVVTITDGTVNTGSIGGGVSSSSTGKIGSAEVTIDGGTIYGQIIMDSTNLASEENCYFKMSGGTIDMTLPNNGFAFTPAQSNGAVVYIVGSGNSTEAIAQLSGGTIKNGHAVNGGAIYIAGGGSMSMSDGTIESCSASENGGAVYIDGGSFTMQGGAIYNCFAQNGGAIFVNSGTVTMENGNLHDNNATYNGGAICIDGGNFLISNGDIQKNAANSGGAIYVNGGKVDLHNGTIHNNSSDTNGGAIYVVGGDIDMYNGTLSENKAAMNGGAIYASSDSVDVTINVFDGVITDNSARLHAGAIGASVEGSFKVTINIGIEGCHADGGAHDDCTCPVILNNEADLYGGAFCLHGFSHSLFINMYCGQIKGNVAIRYPGSNTINQDGGKFSIYGGEVDPGIMVGGGTFEDNRVNTSTVQIRFWGNYDGAPADPIIIECTAGITLNFPTTTYEREGRELSGWTNVADSQDGWVPVGGSYAVYSNGDVYIDYYAVWDAEVSYVVYIPETCLVDMGGVATMDVGANLNYFKKNSDLSVYIHSDFILTNPQNAADVVSYNIFTSEPGMNSALIDGDLCASWQYNNTNKRVLTLKILDMWKSGNWSGVITFAVSYTETDEIGE